MKYPSKTPNERFADTIVHIMGVSGAGLAGLILVILAFGSGQLLLALACALYVTTIIGSKVFSALYHTFPRDALRPLLRRLDHAAIYTLIAGTFTPLLVFVGSTWSFVVLAAVWVIAIPAVLLKLLVQNLDSKWSLVSYLALGWIGVLALPDMWRNLPVAALAFVIAGGLIYTAGTFFYARKTQPFRYAIWHSFVLVGTSAFLTAVYMTVLTTPVT
ncbi:MAG: hemolysin III family protein [Pseudomonadota bacterium]